MKVSSAYMTKLNYQIATKKERNHSAKIFHKNVKIIWKLKFSYIASERRKEKAKKETHGERKYYIKSQHSRWKEQRNVFK